MKNFRSVLVSLVVVACFFLCGFKKPHRHHEASIKKPLSLKSEKNKQKPLDLTVPAARDLATQEFSEPLTLVQHGTASETLIDDNKDAGKAIELKGNVIMSQEPEAGKSKHADGAGIMINLHH